MKTIARILVVIVVLAAVLPLASVSAQEGEGVQSVVGVSGVYFYSAASGSFAEQDDGMYLLTLEGVGPNIIWILQEPYLSSQNLSSANLVDQWAASEGLEGQAVLQIGNLNVSMMLSAPTYDADNEIQTFTANVTSVISLAGDEKEPAVPESFEAATLTIAWTTAFQEGLLQGIEVLYEGVRALTCDEALNAYNDYSAWITPKVNEKVTYTLQCRFGNLSACATAAAIQAEIDAEYASRNIGAIVYQLNNECPAP